MSQESFDESVDQLVRDLRGTDEDCGSIKGLRATPIDLTSEEIEGIIASLRNESDQQRELEFVEIYASLHGKLEIRPTRMGRLVRLTISAGSTFENLRDEVNEKCQQKYDRDAIRRDKSDNFFKNDSSPEDRVFTFFPFVEGVYAESEYNIKLHSNFLNEHKMNRVDPRPIVLACGMFRVSEGIPENQDDIGTAKDSGDLLCGHPVEAQYGYVKTYINGAYRVGIRFTGDFPHLGNVGIAADISPPSNA